MRSVRKVIPEHCIDHERKRPGLRQADHYRHSSQKDRCNHKSAIRTEIGKQPRDEAPQPESPSSHLLPSSFISMRRIPGPVRQAPSNRLAAQTAPSAAASLGSMTADTAMIAATNRAGFQRR